MTAAQTAMDRLSILKTFRHPWGRKFSDQLLNRIALDESPLAQAIAQTSERTIDQQLLKLSGFETILKDPMLPLWYATADVALEVAETQDDKIGSEWFDNRLGDSGFVRFAIPLQYETDTGGQNAHRHILWHISNLGPVAVLVAASFSHWVDDLPYDDDLRALRSDPRWEAARTAGPVFPECPALCIVPFSTRPWRGRDQEWSIINPLIHFWRIARDRTIAYVEAPDKELRRHLRVKRLPAQMGEVNVTVLKRQQTAYLNQPHRTPPRKVEWAHRWQVRGHWRNQPYGPGRKQRRWTWIKAHTKGPENAPLDTRAKVTVVNKQQKAGSR